MKVKSKHGFVFLFIFLTSLSELWAQNIDSLEKVFKKAEGKDKVSVLSQLCYEYGNFDPERAVLLGNEGLALARKIGDEEGIANCSRDIGFAELNQSKYTEAEKSFTLSLEIFTRLNNVKGQATIENAFSILYSYQDKPELALKHAQNTLNYAKELNDQAFIASTLGNIGKLYGDLHNYNKAQSYQLQSLKLCQELHDDYGKAVALGNLGIIFWEQKDTSKALNNTLSAISLFQKNRDNFALGMSRAFASEIYLAKNQTDSSRILIEQALANYDSIQNQQGIAESYLMLSQIAFNKNEIVQSIGLCQLSLAYNAEIQNPIVFIRSNIQLAKCYQKQKKSKDALLFSKDAYYLADSLQNVKWRAETNKILAQVYEEAGNSTLALKHFKKYQELQDSLFNEDKAILSAKMTAGFDLDLKENEISKQKLEIETHNLWRNILIFGLLSIIGLAIYLTWNVRQKLQTNRKLKHLNDQITERNELIETKNIELEEAFAEIEQINHELIAGITYATRLQRAILPSDEEISSASGEYFVWLHPRDLVSGDFYWFVEKDDLKFLATVDCTGHGVPGALMSMIGSALLNQAVLENEIVDPAKILKNLHHGIRQALHTEQTANMDGMDLTLICIDDKAKEIRMAAAKNPLLLFKNGEQLVIKAIKHSIGASGVDDFPAETHTIPIETGLTLYLFSDGFQDQFGGDKKRKYMVNRMYQFLQDIQSENLANQKKKIQQEFFDWTKHVKQMDDVLMIGLRF